MQTLIGPFKQIITMRHLGLKGELRDEQLEILNDQSIAIADGRILAIGTMDELQSRYRAARVEPIDRPAVLLPGFTDCHTHICYAGSRSADYALRVSGHSYLDIARQGGGIWSSVSMTRAATEQKLTQGLAERIQRHLSEGVTTIEVKSGYGLSVEEECKMLRAIQQASLQTPASIVPTCLAAHLRPKDFDGDNAAYLEMVLAELLPRIRQYAWASRVDIFIEQTAFTTGEAIHYLQQASALGFSITVHADQFTTGGSEAAIACHAHSADHLEASGEAEISMLAASETVAVALPGASLGLGMGYTPARKLLDAGACLAIASDWNPGSAPMGDLLMQAAAMGAAEKLSTAETFAGLTFRAAHALRLDDRGILDTGMLAQLQAYPTSDYRDILYYQGKMKPFQVWC